MVAESVVLTGHGGDEIEGYAARPLEAHLSSRPGVLVVHHSPGFDSGTKEIVRRFAARGYSTVCPNLHFRDAPGADAVGAAAACRAAGGAPDHRVVADLAGATRFLSSQPTWNGRSAVVGFCSGGRQALLAACELAFDAVVDCYGAAVLNPPPPEWAVAMPSFRERLSCVSAPVLGLFGQDDVAPAPSEVRELEEVLRGHGVQTQFHTFESAGHAFMSSDRPTYRPQAATEAWRLIWTFLEETLL